MQDGRPWVRGSQLTAGLWVVALAAHLGYGYLVCQAKSMAQLGTATLLLYLVASLGVQRLVVAYRVQRMELTGLAAAVAGGRRGKAAASLWSAAEGRPPRSLRI